MDLKFGSMEINAIKTATESYAIVGGNPVTLLTESAEWLYCCYERTGDELCIKAAKQIINAYMEFGFLYENSSAVFDKILKAAGTKFEDEFPKKVYSTNILKKKVLQIREILGFFPTKVDKRYNAEYIAKDMLSKINNCEHGCFYYGKKENEISFELLILKEDSYLIDLERGKTYIFK